MSAVVIALLACAGAWLLRPAAADPHDYLREPDDVVYGDGSLATVLAHYEVALPGRATDVRFHDEESPIGSGGTLFLHLDVPDIDLTRLLRSLDVGPPTPGVPADWDADGEARRFGWTFAGGSWRGAQGPTSGTVTDSVVVGRVGGGDDSVYVIAEHF